MNNSSTLISFSHNNPTIERLCGLSLGSQHALFISSVQISVNQLLTICCGSTGPTFSAITHPSQEQYSLSSDKCHGSPYILEIFTVVLLYHEQKQPFIRLLVHKLYPLPVILIIK